MTTRYTPSVKGILSGLPKGGAEADKFSAATAPVLICLAKARAAYGLTVEFQITATPARRSRYVVVSKGGKRVQFRIADHPPSANYKPWGGITQVAEVKTTGNTKATLAYITGVLQSI